jgi:hypothetical protein
MKRRQDHEGRSSGASDRPSAVVCSFCGSAQAVISIRNGKTDLCLLHYYTTMSGAEEPTAGIEILDQATYDQHSPAVQDLFASVYLEVRQELQEATALHNQDPLGTILHQLSKPGGFLPREPAAPARLQTVQQAQQRRHEALIRRINKSTATTDTTTATAAATGITAIDLTQRRQPNRSSIWNSVIDAGGLGKPTSQHRQQQKQPSSSSNDKGSSSTSVGTRKHPPSSSTTSADMAMGVTCSSCGNSANVEILQSSQRRQDMAKAEVWSNKDRESDVSQQYRCGQCGKVWHEQE